MNIKRLTLLLLLSMSACSNSFAQKISHDELVEVLGIRSWRVPLPKDSKWGWSFKVINYEPRKPSDTDNEKLDFQNKALLVVRDLGKNMYRFTLKQREGTSQRDVEINICSKKELAAKRCDNRYDITWYAIPMPHDDGLKFVIADITGDSDKLVKQIILAPSSYRQRPSSP